MRKKQEVTAGEKLKNIRTLKGLSAAQLGKLANVSSSIITDIESGRSKSPKLDTIEKISTALDLSPVYFTSSGYMTPTETILYSTEADIPQFVRDAVVVSEMWPYIEIVEKARKEGVPIDLLREVVDTLISTVRQVRKKVDNVAE